MSKAGARDNASTGDDSTHYYSTFAKEDLETILAMYADMFQNLAYSEADFKTEARAILGEYNKNSAEPLPKLLEVQRDTFFQTHTYKHTTMGFIKDIENMPNEYAYSKVFFERWYRPQDTTVIVAGDVDSRARGSDDREVLGRMEGRRCGATGYSQGARSEGAPVCSRAVDRRDVSLGHCGVPGPAVR